MRSFLHFIIGVTKFKISSASMRAFLNFLNKMHISVFQLKEERGFCCFVVYSKHEGEIKDFLHASNIEFEILSRKGIRESVKIYKHRIGIPLGIAFLFFGLIVFPRYIWEINVFGTERLSNDYVLSVLEEHGVHIGAYSPKIDRKKVYMDILSEESEISWISVNFNGSSANVEVVERDYSEVAKYSLDSANIVASKDAYITSISVKKGRGLVNKGDAVKKGDVLVSGIYDNKSGSTRYVCADAEVFAVVSDEYSIEKPLKITEKKYSSEEVCELSLNFFGKRIIFYKNYSNSDTKYDTICRDYNWQFYEQKSIPITISASSALFYEDTVRVLSEKEALDTARFDLNKMISNNSSYVEVLEIEESYYIENDVLYFTANVNAIENIALIKEFKIN